MAPAHGPSDRGSATSARWAEAPPVWRALRMNYYGRSTRLRLGCGRRLLALRERKKMNSTVVGSGVHTTLRVCGSSSGVLVGGERSTSRRQGRPEGREQRALTEQRFGGVRFGWVRRLPWLSPRRPRTSFAFHRAPSPPNLGLQAPGPSNAQVRAVKLRRADEEEGGRGGPGC